MKEEIEPLKTYLIGLEPWILGISMPARLGLVDIVK